MPYTDPRDRAAHVKRFRERKQAEGGHQVGVFVDREDVEALELIRQVRGLRSRSDAMRECVQLVREALMSKDGVQSG